MLHLVSDSILYAGTVSFVIRCVSRIPALSSMFIQLTNPHMRIETPPALLAVGALIRTYRSFYWMNTSNKVDNLYIMTIAELLF